MDTDDEVQKMLDEIDTDIKRNKKTKKTKKKETKKKIKKIESDESDNPFDDAYFSSDNDNVFRTNLEENPFRKREKTLAELVEEENIEEMLNYDTDAQKEFEKLLIGLSDTDASEGTDIGEDEIRKILFGSETETEPVDIAEKIADKIGEENVISLMSLEGEELQEVIDNAIKERNKLRNQPSKKTFKERKKRAEQRRERAKQLSYIDVTGGVMDKEGVDLYSAYPEEEFDEAKNLLKEYKEDFMFEKEKLKNMEKKSEKYKKQNFKLTRLKNIYDLQKEKVEVMKNLQKNIPYEFRGTPLPKKNNK
tara:strand:+ start:797 stop:1717 length:921 start_codon:yes stop_codon:yes gene_type:complete